MIANDFSTKWNHPCCLGAIDGKHIEILKPPNSGSDYFNYKKYCSIVLLAVVDADMKFIYVDVGSPGKCSDGGIWSRCTLNQSISDGLINFPNNFRIGEVELPHVFVGDAGFPLTNRMMRPFPGKELDHDKLIFNYRQVQF